MVNNTQYLTGGKSPNPLEPPSNFLASPGNAKVTLTWTDPPNATVEPSGQTYATWAYTQVVRKEGSQPTGPHDGIVVVQSSVRDQYATSGFVDTGLTNDTLYYYGAFAYNSDKVASEGAFVSATPQAGTPLSELTEGTLITINENGAPIQFYIAKQNYEEALNGKGRVLIVRYLEYIEHVFDTNINSTNLTYFTSELNKYINERYVKRFSQSTVSLISSTKYYYNLYGNYGDAKVGNNPFFILSLDEYGGYRDDISHLVNPCGTKLPISDILKSTTRRESWTRSRHRTVAGWAFAIEKGGKLNASKVNAPAIYFRPCFTLPSTALVDSNNALIET